MANPTTGMLQTLVAAASMASANLVFKNAMLKSVFMDYQPVVATPYTSLNVLIPTVNEGDVADIGSGPLQPTDTAHTSVSIPFNQHPSVSFVIKSWDQVRTPADLERLFIRPKTEALLRKVNRYVANLVTTGNFPNYSAVSGAGTAKFQRADIATAWNNLVTAGVPVEDEGNMSFVTSPTAWSNMMSDPNFYQQYIVGEAAATQLQQKGSFAPQFNAQLKYDQQIPKSGSATESALYFHRFAIAVVTAHMPPSEDPSVKETTFFPIPGLPVQIQIQYSVKDQGWLVNIHCGFGLKVVRPEMGSYLQSA